MFLGFGTLARLDPIGWVAGLFGGGATMGEPAVMGAAPPEPMMGEAPPLEDLPPREAPKNDPKEAPGADLTPEEE